MSAGVKKRVLVADDDPAIRSLVARALSQDYEILLAEDGPSALARLSQDPRPDLALLDVMMPGFDGFGVVERLRLVPGRKVPVIFLTARDAPQDIIHGIQLGARHYIAKPFALKDLLAKVQKVLGT